MTKRSIFLKACLWPGITALILTKPAGPQQTSNFRTDAAAEPVVRAVEFESRKVYQSDQHPSYASWASFFPGEKGQWYIGCVEQKKVNPPRPASTSEQNYWRNGGAMPPGYDHKQNHIEMLLLESRDQLQTWKVVSRWDADPIGTAAWGAFAQARTSDGRFLRFIWHAYTDELDPKTGKLIGNKIFYISGDNGKTWQLQPPFHDDRFFSFAHRLRTLRDGTMVLAVPFAPGYGPGQMLPVRVSWDPQVDSVMQMTLYFSQDQGRHWSGPMPIYGGHVASETDFVELPSGDLLFINWMTSPGRQIVYRTKHGWLPGLYERCAYNKMRTVPETVCLTREGILVGCLRPGRYFWSDDLGKTWQPLEGIPDRGPEVYQPWMQYLPDGRIACVGHFGADDPMGLRDQYISLHLFRLQIRRKVQETKLSLQRDFDQSTQKWKNSYTLKLTADGAPLASKPLEVWYVERDQPGYDPFGKLSLEERMKLGGHTISAQTGADGKARVAFPQFDNLSWQHHAIQLVARFNADRKNPQYKPAQTLMFEFYTWTR